MTLKIIRIPEICDRKGEGRSTFYNRVRDGLWPKPIAIGPRLVGQPESEVNEMLAAIISGKSDDELRALVTRLEAARKTAGEEKRPMAAGPPRGAKQRAKQSARRVASKQVGT